MAATGLVALLLLTATVVLGITSAGRLATPRWPRFVIAAIHRNLSLLSVVFLGVHIATAVIDPYAGISWAGCGRKREYRGTSCSVAVPDCLWADTRAACGRDQWWAESGT